MARRDFLEEPPAYDSLFDTSAELPNYASIAQARQTGPSSCQPSSTTSDSSREPRRGSATSTNSDASTSSCSSSASSSSRGARKASSSSKKTTTTNDNSNTNSSESKGERFLSKWRADLAEDRARRAKRVVHISASEADRITGLDQRVEPKREVRWRVYWER